MKKVVYLFAVVALTAGFVSCSNDDDHDFSNADRNLELRASALGYSDVASYQASVAEQCAAGNHENCDIQTDGTHQVCAYNDHSGTKHDGTRHNGSAHGTHDANGHSHNSHGGNHH
ncbi:MAG: hypothetical protein LBV74_20855 [Tannerella sp.]|nr:hypothetical protein [Tannerella sp.]